MRVRFQIGGDPVAVDAEPHAGADRIRAALSGNLYRCIGHVPIVEAVLDACAACRKAGNP